MSAASSPKMLPEAPIVGTPAAKSETANPMTPATKKITHARAEPYRVTTSCR